MTYQLIEICNVLNDYEIHGNTKKIINKITTPLLADEKSLVFISANRTDKQELFDKTKAGAVVCDASFQAQVVNNKCAIIVKDPKYAFAKIGNHFFLPKITPSIHASAVIHPNAKIGKNVYIGPHVYIGECEIGDEVVIHGHSYLYDNVKLAEKVLVQAGCIIGASGCGHIKNEYGIYEPFPHVAGVVIESGVEIGTHCCIARGALIDTVIKKNCVIDSFVQIGHNVLVEENVIILANSVVGGSSIIKRNAILSIGSHICDCVTVGEGAHIGPGVVVMQDVAEKSKVVVRAPMTLAQ